MTSYRLRPRFVEATQLSLENWKELADLVRGVFHQRVEIRRGTLSSIEPTGTLTWTDRNSVDRDTQKCEIGDYVVDEGLGWYRAWTRTEFEGTFELYQRADLFAIDTTGGDNVRP